MPPTIVSPLPGADESSSAPIMPHPASYQHLHYHCPPPLPPPFASPPPAPVSVPSSPSRHPHDAMLSSIDLEISAILHQEINILERAPTGDNNNTADDRDSSPSKLRASSSSWENLMCRLLYDTNRRKKQLQHQKDQILREMLALESSKSRSKQPQRQQQPNLKPVPKSVSPSHSVFASSYAHLHVPVGRVGSSTCSSSRNTSRGGSGGRGRGDGGHHLHSQMSGSLCYHFHLI